MPTQVWYEKNKGILGGRVWLSVCLLFLVKAGLPLKLNHGVVHLRLILLECLACCLRLRRCLARFLQYLSHALVQIVTG